MSTLLIRTSFPPTPPTVVTIGGEIDLASIPALRPHLRALPAASTTLELSGVGLLSGAGVAELVDLRDRLARADAPLALVAAQSIVRRVLDITGVAGSVILAVTLDEAALLIATASPQHRPARRRTSAVRSCSALRPRVLR